MGRKQGSEAPPCGRARTPETACAGSNRFGRLSVLLPLAALGVLAAATFASRWWLRCDHLLAWDTVQGAASILHYDVALHIPHPPGEPLYTAVLRLVNLLVGSPHDTVLLVSCLGDALAVVLVYFLVARAVSARAAVIAAMLFLLSPLGWHASTVGMTFGLDVCFGAGIGLVVIRLARRPSTAHAMILAVLLALAPAVRCNVNWAGIALLPLGIYGLWQVPRPVRLKSALVLAAVLAAWIVPMILWGGSRPGFLGALVEHFGEASWSPSALGRVFEGDFAAVPGAMVGAMADYALAGVQALGAAAILLPLLLIPVRRADREATEATPWRLVLLWILPTLALLAAGPYHAEEYVAVTLPAWAILASLGVLRTAYWTRWIVTRWGVRQQTADDRLQRAFMLTHVMVFCACNLVLLTGLMWRDPASSRTLLGRTVESARVQLGHADHLREQWAPSIELLRQQYRDRKTLVVSNLRHEFLLYALYVPEKLCLWVCQRDGVPVAVFAKDRRLTFQEIGQGTNVTLPEEIELVLTTDQLGDEVLEVSQALQRIGLRPHDELVLKGMYAYAMPPNKLQLHHEASRYRLGTPDDFGGRAGPVAQTASASAQTGARR